MLKSILIVQHYLLPDWSSDPELGMTSMIEKGSRTHSILQQSTIITCPRRIMTLLAHESSRNFYIIDTAS